MPDPDTYAAEQAAMLRDDWQFSRIFAGNAQAGFTALLALRAELQQVLVQVNEPAIAAMKFEWWRNEIARGFLGEAQHPLARSLGEHLSKAGSAPEYCVEIIDAAEMESDAPLDFSDQDFRLYLYRSGGVLAEQLALLSGTKARNTLDASRHLGELKRFSDLVLATGAMLRAGVWLFPADWLDEQKRDAVLDDDAHAERQQLAQQLLNELDKQRVVTRTAMEDIALPPALALQWSLSQRDYHAVRKNPDCVFDAAPAKGNPMHRLWSAWRGARNAAKADK